MVLIHMLNKIWIPGVNVVRERGGGSCAYAHGDNRELGCVMCVLYMRTNSRYDFL